MGQRLAAFVKLSQGFRALARKRQQAHHLAVSLLPPGLDLQLAAGIDQSLVVFPTVFV